MTKEKQQEEAVSQEEVEVKQEPITDFKRFEYGDLYIKCEKCGADTSFTKGIRGGFQVYLPSTDKHEIILECSECKNRLSMHWKESENIDELREKDTQVIQARVEELKKQQVQLEYQLQEVEMSKAPVSEQEPLEDSKEA